MKIVYYPGCTLKTKARNLEEAALASLEALGVEAEELERWNCCGAVFSLADDDLIHQIAPVRVLVRAKDAGADKVVTLCSQCYNTLARANQLIRDDEEKRKTINLFMDDETDYAGEVEVVHYLEVLRDQVGWEKLRGAVKKPLTGMKIAPFYGCALIRPLEFAIGKPEGQPTIMEEFLTALGATPTTFSAALECCGSYETLINPEQGSARSAKVLGSALKAGVDALALSCPMCDYNLERRQAALREVDTSLGEIPVYYFSQLLAVALGLDAEVWRFDLNIDIARAALAERNLLEAGGA